MLGDRARYFRAACPGLRGGPRDPLDGPVPPGQRARPEAARGLAPLRRGVLPQPVDLSRRPGPRLRLAVLDRLLAADGVLFIGHADRLDLAGEPSRFAAAGEPGCFAFRKSTGEGLGTRGEPVNRTDHAGLAPHRETPTRGLPAPTLDPPRTQPNPERRKSEGSRLNRSSPTHPSSFILHPSEKPSELLEQAAELANQGRHAEAIATCEQHIRLKGPGALGVLLDGDDLPGGRRPPSGRGMFPQDGLPRPEA